MKDKKYHKKEIKPKIKDQIDELIPNGKKRKEKIKYRHMNHWLEDEDDEYIPPSYRDEEE